MTNLADKLTFDAGTQLRIAFSERRRLLLENFRLAPTGIDRAFWAERILAANDAQSAFLTVFYDVTIAAWGERNQAAAA